jgi:hypothetical protein
VITDLDLILADLQANWILYLSMPFVAAAIGYGTKVVAIKMMFKPLKFVGWRPFFGWQGIVPSKAATMASIACDLMMERLLDPVGGRHHPGSGGGISAGPVGSGTGISETADHPADPE